MIKLINQFAKSVVLSKTASSQIEIYNEFSLQHEIGVFLRRHFPTSKVQFERNIKHFSFSSNFIKKEIDISVFSPNKDILKYAIELKFPRNGQYPEQMYSFCRDIVFVEQLKRAGFQRTFLIIFANDHLFYNGSGNGIYEYFRKGKKLHGTIKKPTGSKNTKLGIKGTYRVKWYAISSELKYTIIEANNR